MNPSDIDLPSHITVANANSVYHRLQQIKHTAETAAVDLATVTRCDSAGVAALIEFKAEQAAGGRVVHYLNPAEQLQELARFLKVDVLLFHA